MALDYRKITEQTYSLWLGRPNILCTAKPSISFMYSPERDVVQPGYSNQFDVYALLQENRIFVSFGTKAAGKLGLLKQRGSWNPNDFSQAICEIDHRQPERHIQFCYRPGNRHADSRARALEKTIYQNISRFFKKRIHRAVIWTG